MTVVRYVQSAWGRWIPTFAGMTVVSAGMTVVDCGNDGGGVCPVCCDLGAIHADKSNGTGAVFDGVAGAQRGV